MKSQFRIGKKPRDTRLELLEKREETCKRDQRAESAYRSSLELRADSGARWKLGGHYA